VPEHDLQLRGVFAGGAIVLAGIAVSVALAWLLVSRLGIDPAGPNGQRPAPIRGAVLQTTPQRTLAELRRAKTERLESRGPIAGEPGRVHIPIEQAMQILARRARQ
jgi:hypothetical protein